MENENQNFLSQIRNLWTRMNASERLMVVVALAVLGIALIVWLGLARTQGYALLYGGLEPAD
ncbi:MAG TPA: hypothetical protein ENN67_05790, partial [Firmicutes bacterium]|nr:hypothetical protein [Bacillota bacterium]